MELLLAYLISVLLSGIIMDSQYYIVAKKLANDGFLFDKKSFNAKYEQELPTFIIVRLIPIINLITSLIYAKYQSAIYEDLTDELLENNIIEVMSQEEGEYYFEHPSLIKVLKLNKSKEEIANICNIITLFDGSIAYYTYDENDKLIIMRSCGPISMLNAEEKAKRLEYVLSLYESFIAAKIPKDRVNEVVSKTKLIDFSDINDYLISKEEFLKLMNVKIDNIDLSQSQTDDINISENIYEIPFLDDKPKTLKKTKNNKKNKKD